MSDNPAPLPDFTRWPSFPFEGDIRVKPIEDPVDVEPPRAGEDGDDCTACGAPDEAYIWVSDRWRVRAMDRPTGLPMVLILESRSHLDLGDLPNMLAAELGVMTVRLERAIRSIDGVARVHVNRWGDGAAHLHLWFMARPRGHTQFRGIFLPLWDEILPPVSEAQWRENLALIAAWLADFGGTPLAEPPHIDWKAPAKLAAITGHPILDEAGVDVSGRDPDEARPDDSAPAGAEATTPEPPALDQSAPGPAGAGTEVTGPEAPGPDHGPAEDSAGVSSSASAGAPSAAGGAPDLGAQDRGAPDLGAQDRGAQDRGAQAGGEAGDAATTAHESEERGDATPAAAGRPAGSRPAPQDDPGGAARPGQAPTAGNPKAPTTIQIPAQAASPEHGGEPGGSGALAAGSAARNGGPGH